MSRLGFKKIQAGSSTKPKSLPDAKIPVEFVVKEEASSKAELKRGSEVSMEGPPRIPRCKPCAVVLRRLSPWEVERQSSGLEEKYQLSRMEEIETNIKNILPSLDDNVYGKVLQCLVEMGVSDCSHLHLVEEADLKDVLKTIQARLLIRSWKSNKRKTNESVTAQESISHQPTVLSQVQSSPKVPDNFDWAYDYEVPWKSMPMELLKPLEEGKRPAPKLRRKFIQIVTNDIHRICQKPGRKGLAIIARKIVQKYSASFIDVLCEQVVGEGYSSILKQMEVRFDNMNRDSPYNVLKRSVNENRTEVKKKKISVADTYGCLNWQPSQLPLNETEETQQTKKIIMINMSYQKIVDITEMKKLLEDTYYSQRKDINSKNNIAYLKEEWPLLFKKEGMLWHFQMLMEFDILQRLNDALVSKGLRIFNFLKKIPKKKQEKKMKEILDSSSVDIGNPEFCTLIMLLIIYFEEDVKELFTAVDVTMTPDEVENLNLPITPHLEQMLRMLIPI